MYFQDLILTLQKFWKNQGCVLVQPYDIEKGAGTFNPATFLRSLGPEPFSAAYPEPCRRPTDGRYGDNPIRMQHYYQFQVILKPNPKNILDLYLQSLAEIGIHPEDHDIRFVHDDWETAALGAWGLGWEVWCDGTEITQFTYFQQVGGIDLEKITGEITYGLERICMFLQGVDSVYDIQFNEHFTYGEIFHQNEVQFSKYNFELADIDSQLNVFNMYEKECIRLCEENQPHPAADAAMKASHAFNILDARGAISVNERQAYVLRIRTLAKQVSESWLENRKELGHPLLKSGTKPFLESQTSEIDTIEMVGGPKTAPLLIELGVEEMPAKVFKGLFQSLQELSQKILAPSNLNFEPLQFYATPRRIVIYSPAVETRQKDQSLELKGPPVNIAKDKDGNWTKAAEGFAKKNNIPIQDLQTKVFGKAEYLFAQTEVKGKSALEIFAEAIPQLFSKLPWYKTMRWGEGDMIGFVRPVHWLTALLGNQIIPTEFAGVKSSNTTLGHRFLSQGEILVTPENYFDSLQKAHVIVKQEERKKEIKTQLEAIAKENNLLWREDEELLDHVAYLVEYPFAVHGYFKEDYLEIPDEVLVSEMREHQKYFALNQQSGNLHNSFVAISNMKCKEESIVKAGYEKVLVSRLKDAEFFLKEDQKVTLEERVEKLGQLTFEKSLGTMLDKCQRIEEMGLWIADELKLEEGSKKTISTISKLCKADLTTAMVFEFPELQGTIGSHYANLQGLEKEVAQGIEDHYLPAFTLDDLPENIESAIVGISDRMDTITGFFGIGKEPTGSADPFALRRAAIGILLLCMKHNISIPLNKLTQQSIQSFTQGTLKKEGNEVVEKIQNFFKQRIIRLFHEQVRDDIPAGIPLDLISSVMETNHRWDEISDLSIRVEAMNQFRNNDNFNELAGIFKRVNNILDEKASGVLDPALFNHSEENDLLGNINEIRDKFSENLKVKNYFKALNDISTLGKPVHALFENVLLNDEDEKVRNNRHLLIKEVRDLVRQIADFSMIQEPAKKAASPT